MNVDNTNHQDIQYSQVASAPQLVALRGSLAFARDEAHDLDVVTWACPACSATFTESFATDYPRMFDLDTRDAPSSEGVLDLICKCGCKHVGGDGKPGCGFAAKQRVERTGAVPRFRRLGHRAVPVLRVVPDASPVAMTVQDRQWADRAATLDLDALSSARTLAEKWAAALTSLLTVVGLAGLFGTAGKFDKLAGPWDTVAKVSFIIAVVAGLVATFVALRAAEGTTQRIFFPGGTALRLYSREQVRKATSALTLSRVLAGLAASFVLVAGFALWFGDQAKSPPTIIQVPTHSLVCPAGVGPAEVSGSDAKYILRCGK